MPNQPEEKNKTLIRPDPLFKDVTRRAALAAGLELLDIELPQLLRADLVLAVPKDKDLTDTLFDFLSPYSILEFKSENDDFDRSELAKNLARSLLFLGENTRIIYSQLLTVFVCAERPDQVIEHLTAEGMVIDSDPTKPWLQYSQFGPLKIAIVVCRLLPLEKRYYDWLLFAPATSRKWREFVKMLVRNGEKTLIEQVKSLRLKEYRLMTPQLREMLKDLSPEEQEEHNKDLLELLDTEVDMLEELDPKKADEFILKRFAKLTPEQRKKILALFSQPDQPAPEENQPPN